jgi:hypothetical protein
MPDVAQHAHFRVFSNGAGVDNNQVCGRFVVSKRVPHILQHTPDKLAVRLILLTAVGVYVRKRGNRFIATANPCHYQALLIQLFL